MALTKLHTVQKKNKHYSPVKLWIANSWGFELKISQEKRDAEEGE